MYAAFPLTADGRVDERLFGTISFTTDGRYLDIDRLATTSGRVLDPDNPHEVMVNQSFVDAAGVGVGSSFEIGIIETDDDGNPTTLEPAPADRLDVTVTGVMVLNEEITSEDIDTVPRLFVSPAARRMPVGDPRYYGFSWYGLTVDGGPAAVDEVQVAWQRLADAHNAIDRVAGGGEDGWLSYVHRTSDLQRKADRAVRPLTITLGAFGVLAYLGAVTLASQALVRRVRSQRNAVTIARVLGLTPHEGALATLVAPGVSLAVALLAAAATAVVLSLAFPVGPFDVLEPSTGLDVDLLVLGPGLLLLVLVPLAVITVAAWRESRLATVVDDGGSRTVGRLTSVIGRHGAFPGAGGSEPAHLRPGTWAAIRAHPVGAGVVHDHRGSAGDGRGVREQPAGARRQPATIRVAGRCIGRLRRWVRTVRQATPRRGTGRLARGRRLAVRGGRAGDDRRRPGAGGPVRSR